MKARYLVTPTDTRVPAVRIVADDLIDLGSQVAEYFARHRRLSKGVQYDAQIGDDHGSIRQTGLPRPLMFTIERDAR